MLSDKKLEAMLYLLDDEDEQIIEAVESQLMAMGPEIIPSLEKYWQNNQDPLRAFRIENLIRHIQDAEIEKDLKIWLAGNGDNLQEACLLINRIHYPSYNYDFVKQFISEISLDCWLLLYNASTPAEKVFVLNQIFFQKFGFKGNTENYNHPDNSFFSRVIETKRGNPITLCCLYSIVAQRLGIPIFGVNLPHHFVLAYCEELSDLANQIKQNDQPLDRNKFGKVLFYINPFKLGITMSKIQIEEFLKTNSIPEQTSFFEPCTNIEIVKRMLRNLQFAYSEQNDQYRLLRVQKFMEMLGM